MRIPIGSESSVEVKRDPSTADVLHFVKHNLRSG